MKRTTAQVAAEAVAADRKAIVAHAQAYCDGVRGLIAKRRVTAQEADLLCRRITAFAEDIAQGLHVTEVKNPKESARD